MQTVYKVRNDGSHYYGTRMFNDFLPENDFDARTGEVLDVEASTDINDYRSENESLTKGRSIPRYKGLSDYMEAFDGMMDEAYAMGLNKYEVRERVIQQLGDRFGPVLFYVSAGRNAFPGAIPIEDFYMIARKKRTKSLIEKRKRFRDKAFLNPFNYFCTFTYDSRKMTEEEFVDRIQKCFSNLHTRKGWRYMYVYERGHETGRLHIHGLFAIPDGAMVGDIREDRRYDKNDEEMKTSHINGWFEDRFGRNDFVEIESIRDDPSVMKYVIKYVGKTDGRIVYSRGIPSFVFVRSDGDVICLSYFEYYESMTCHVFFDDLMERSRVVPMRC